MATEFSHQKPRPRTNVAVIAPWCTGCGGSPVCMIYCKKNALRLIKDKQNYPFYIMTVDDALCIGCGACVSKGQQGIMLSGCPWDAIRMERRPENG